MDLRCPFNLNLRSLWDFKLFFQGTHSPLIALFLTLFLGLFGSTDSHARSNAPDASQPGSFVVARGNYKFPSSVDPDVLKTAPTELWANAHWPADLSKPRPIIFMLHGNHATCGFGKNPRVDMDCSYSIHGECHGENIIVPNHEGYNYLAEYLASQGFVVVSINSNRGINCGAGEVGDDGLILARGRLVLKHIEQWFKWSNHGGAPPSLVPSNGALKGAIDFSKVGLMGHSRGGEGMRAALALYRERGSPWPNRIPRLEIRGIYEIASVDGMSSQILDADDTPWNQLLPMCDGDVSDLQGRMPFERMIQKSSELRKTPKSLTMAWGANHNFFNTEWQESDSWGCTGHEPIFGNEPFSLNQQKIAKSSVSAFFRAHLGAPKNSEMKRHFDPAFTLPQSLVSITRLDRDYYPTHDEFFSKRIEDFSRQTGLNSVTGEMNSANGVQIEHIQGELPAHARVSWKKASPQAFFQINSGKLNSGHEISRIAFLNFRIAREIYYEENNKNGGQGKRSDQNNINAPTLNPSHLNNHGNQNNSMDGFIPEVIPDAVLMGALKFSIALVDSRGKLSKSVDVSPYAEIFGPISDVPVFQTVRIPINDFGLSSTEKVMGVRFIFDRNPTGAIKLAHVRLTTDRSPLIEESLNTSLPPTDPQYRPDPPDNGSNENDFQNEWVNNTETNTTVDWKNKNLKNLVSNTRHSMNQSAEFVRASILSRSRYLFGRPAVEMTFKASQGRFPVSDQLPVLFMSQKSFSISRFGESGRTDTLVFTIPREEIRNLPRTGPMWIQYGKHKASRLWQLPDYDRSRLGD